MKKTDQKIKEIVLLENQKEARELIRLLDIVVKSVGLNDRDALHNSEAFTDRILHLFFNNKENENGSEVT